jgi:catechol 2,3-dioxygenase-like lactoylglutathione lyase family enzyme
MIAVTGVTAMFHVYDVPRSVGFYRDVLGFAVVQTSPPLSGAKDDFGWCLLRLGGAELMLNNMYENNVRPETPDAVRAAGHADASLYFACPDVDGAYAYLKAKGVEAGEPKDSYYGLRQMYLNDPDGYTLCFQTRSK